MRLSAYALARRDDCERRFVLDFVLRLPWPAGLPGSRQQGENTATSAGSTAERAKLGQEFHRAVQRHRLGIPVHPEGELGRLWQAFLTSPYSQDQGESRWTEQVLQFALPGAKCNPVPGAHGKLAPGANDQVATGAAGEGVSGTNSAAVPFIVRYDEVRKLADGTWLILDWKTGNLRRDGIENLWQSRLYRFALAEAGAVLNGGQPIPPADIKLVYWLVRAGSGLPLSYDATRFEADRQALLAIAGTATVPLDQARWPASSESCRSCPFDSFCNNLPAPPAAPSPLALPTFIP